MIKIRVSYENEEELKKFLLLVQEKIEKIKYTTNNQGRFKKAYIKMKDNK